MMDEFAGELGGAPSGKPEHVVALRSSEFEPRFRVQGLGFWRLGFRVQDLGFRV